MQASSPPSGARTSTLSYASSTHASHAARQHSTNAHAIAADSYVSYCLGDSELDFDDPDPIFIQHGAYTRTFAHATRPFTHSSRQLSYSAASSTSAQDRPQPLAQCSPASLRRDVPIRWSFTT